jgi:hypothetical protein
MLHLITFADDNYKNAALQLKKQAEGKKCFKTIKVYDNNWWEKNKGSSPEENCKLGNGYWIWKPKIILERLNNPDVSYNDIIIYIDAGKSLIDSSKKINRVANNTKNIQYQISGYPEIDWTMKKVWDYFNMDLNQYLIQASAHNIIVKKTKESLAIINEWASINPYYFGLTDKNVQVERFKEHRHDQSLFSMLMHKYKISPSHDFLTYRRNDESVNYYWLSQRHKYKFFNIAEQWWTYECQMKKRNINTRKESLTNLIK